MQKLTYVNLLGESVDFFHEPYILESVEGLGATASRTATVTGAYQNGESLRGLLKAKRAVDLRISVRGRDRADLYTKRRELAGVLAAEKSFDGRSSARLIYENDAGSWWTWAVPDGGLEGGKRAADYIVSASLSFLCESAYWFSAQAREAAFLYTGDGFTLPYKHPVSFGSRDFALDVTNDGQVAAPLEITIRGQGEQPAIRNATTSERLMLTALLPVGSTLNINTDPARLDATITDAAGERGAYGLLSIDTPLSAFRLAPGVNRLIYEPGGAAAQSEILLRWFDRFEGV